MVRLLLSEIKRDYSKYGLTKNPFPYAGIPEDNPEFCIDREIELEKIQECIGVSLGGSSTHLALIGNYGNGKTHILKYVRSEINKQLTLSEFKAAAGFVINPGQSFADIYRNFMHDLGIDFFKRAVWRIIGKIVISANKHDVFYKKVRRLSKILRELQKKPEMVKKYVEEGHILLPAILGEARKILMSTVKSVDIVNAFLQLVMDENYLLAWKWISGELTLHEQRKQIGVVTNIDKDHRALDAFLNIKSILRIAGIKLICVLIDEFENLESLSLPQKQNLLNSIRHLIDLNPNGLCIIIACTPETWKSIIKEYHAFSERIFKEVLLKPLNEQTIKRFIAEYLNHYKGDQNANIEFNPPLYPFTEDAINLILKASQGNVRRILSLCNLALDSACMEGAKEITCNVVENLKNI